MLSFLIMGFVYRLPLLRIRSIRTERQVQIFWFCFWAIFAASHVYVIAVFGSNLKFANFFSDEVYSVRLAARELSSTGLVGYVLM